MFEFNDPYSELIDWVNTLIDMILGEHMVGVNNHIHDTSFD